MGLQIHVFHNQGQESIITFEDLKIETENYFKDNSIKVSIERLNGETIAYGCPVSDKDEESEVIVLGGNKTLKVILEELATECILTFGGK